MHRTIQGDGLTRTHAHSKKASSKGSFCPYHVAWVLFNFVMANMPIVLPQKKDNSGEVQGNLAHITVTVCRQAGGCSRLEGLSLL